MSETGDQYYEHYKPSLAAAVIFVVLFTVSTVYHFWQLFRRRTWYFLPFAIGGIFQIVGYLSRAISSTQFPDSNLGVYVIQYLLILLAPALYAASIYMVLGRIIRVTGGEQLSLIRVSWLTKIFVTGDVISFLVQCIGGGVLASADTSSDRDRGEVIITIGLIVQIIFFGLFILVSVHYNWRLGRAPTDASRTTPISWQFYLYVLYATNGLIMVRSVFRLIEYVQGEDGELLSNEIYLYIFDAGLMFLTMVILNWKHPSILIPAKVMERGRDSEAESGSIVMQEQRR
ncbi:RTA1 like protein-domain-containing protein [Macrophomina phaseolina]|uniref:RTA1 like protein-domain-containing protein n=1 Tax=Macrophomina phaseolina TaxID=35725 RepID=A0ABQ8GE60_9PEZI|nr:RTA1 like protein-domain-containing protein [Macrophomina phaseolina]